MTSAIGRQLCRADGGLVRLGKESALISVALSASPTCHTYMLDHFFSRLEQSRNDSVFFARDAMADSAPDVGCAPCLSL